MRLRITKKRRRIITCFCADPKARIVIDQEGILWSTNISVSFLNHYGLMDVNVHEAIREMYKTDPVFIRKVFKVTGKLFIRNDRSVA